MGVSISGAAATGAAASGRRAPVQERSQETVARVVAAAGRLLARGVGPEGLTTAQIAAEAGLSVGALYRFFPDKQAVVDAVAVGHLERFQEGLAARLMLGMPDSPEAFIGVVMDGFAAYLAANPDFLMVAYGTPGRARAISLGLLEAQAGAGELASLVRELLGEVFGVEVDAGFDFRLRIATEIGDRLLAHAFAQDDTAARARVLEEAKGLIGRYLFGT